MLWLLAASFVLLGEATANYHTVDTRFGKVRGIKITSRGRSGYAFTGIPFAKPPLGDLRFRNLVDPDTWTAPIDAFNYRNACLSNPLKTYEAESGGPVDEDCMYTNVFTSDKCLQKGGCAVMVVVHGGSRNFESPVIYDKKIIIHNFANEERNVIVVSIAYRMGVVGWMHLAPGMKTSTETNLAIRDIIFNLEWIQKEIRSFGGDPSRVTLMGHSAGSVQALETALSPLSEGLFSQLLHMSGFSTGGERTTNVNHKYSRKVAHLLNCAEEMDDYENKTRVEEIIGCLRRKTGKEMLDAQFVMHNYVEENHGTWIDGKGGVFPTYLKELLRRPKAINVLLGTVTAEYRDPRPLTGMPDKVDELCTHVAYERNYENPEGFRRVCNEYYGQENMTQFLNDDLIFYHHQSSLADAFSTRGDVFVYSFSYEGGRSAFKRAKIDYQGPSHAEDFMLVFGLHRVWENFDEKNAAMEDAYTGIMANFVNTGNPEFKGQKWEKWEKRRRNYFHIDFDENMKMPGMKENYYKDAENFWEHTAYKAGGNWRPLRDFPPEVDIYTQNAISISMVARMNGVSIIYDKNLQAEELTYETWTRHLQKLMRKKRDVIFEETPETAEEGSNNVLFLAGLLASACLLFVGGYCFIIRFCRQKEYEVLNA